METSYMCSTHVTTTDLTDSVNKVDDALTVGPQEWRAREVADAAAGCTCAPFHWCVFILVIDVWQIHILLWKRSGEFFFSNIFESKLVQSIEATHGYQARADILRLLPRACFEVNMDSL